jgi:hypothetical protein
MKTPAGRNVLVGVTIVTVVATVITAIVMLGPPGEERARRLDGRRARELQGISAGVDAYWMSTGRLPGSLDEISKQSGAPGLPAKDPVTGAPYGYRVVDEKSYELCATFDRVSNQQFGGDLWMHGAGNRCFTRKAGASQK